MGTDYTPTLPVRNSQSGLIEFPEQLGHQQYSEQLGHQQYSEQLGHQQYSEQPGHPHNSDEQGHLKLPQSGKGSLVYQSGGFSSHLGQRDISQSQSGLSVQHLTR